jgi:hypothetical protein
VKVHVGRVEHPAVLDYEVVDTGVHLDPPSVVLENAVFHLPATGLDVYPFAGIVQELAVFGHDPAVAVAGTEIEPVSEVAILSESVPVVSERAVPDPYARRGHQAAGRGPVLYPTVLERHWLVLSADVGSEPVRIPAAIGVLLLPVAV